MTRMSNDNGVRDRIEDTASLMGERVQAAFGSAGERVAKATDGAQRRTQQLIEALGATMQRHPLATIGVGLGVGFVLARALSRK